MTLSAGYTEKGLRGGNCMGLSPGKYGGWGLTGGRPFVRGGGIPNEILGGGTAAGGDAGLGGSGMAFSSLSAMMSHLSSSSNGEDGLGLGLDFVIDAI